MTETMQRSHEDEILALKAERDAYKFGEEYAKSSLDAWRRSAKDMEARCTRQQEEIARLRKRRDEKAADTLAAMDEALGALEKARAALLKAREGVV
jgi:hypothetical protein